MNGAETRGWGKREAGKEPGGGGCDLVILMCMDDKQLVVRGADCRHGGGVPTRLMD